MDERASGMARLGGVHRFVPVALACLLVAPGFPPVVPGLGPVLRGLGPIPVRAQTPSGVGWSTLSQQVEVDMRAGDGGADVVVRYRLGSAEEGGDLPSTEPVTFELLGFGDATAGEIVVGRPDRSPAERVVLWPTVGSHRVAVVEPPHELDGRTLTLTVSYRVENAIEGLGADGGGEGAGGDLAGMIHARIPVLTGPPVRAESGGVAFEARLTVPGAWRVTEGFPSGLQEVGDGAHSVSLTVAPSIVGFRASTDGRWRPGLPFLMDVLTVLILASFLGVGWRHLRRMAA